MLPYKYGRLKCWVIYGMRKFRMRNPIGPGTLTRH
jgi:hypothetical protein